MFHDTAVYKFVKKVTNNMVVKKYIFKLTVCTLQRKACASDSRGKMRLILTHISQWSAKLKQDFIPTLHTDFRGEYLRVTEKFCVYIFFVILWVKLTFNHFVTVVSAESHCSTVGLKHVQFIEVKGNIRKKNGSKTKKRFETKLPWQHVKETCVLSIRDVD